MNIVPIHFAPHHNDHLPLCGARTLDHGGDTNVLICTLDRDDTTCFRCIDVAEERAANEAMIARLEAELAFDLQQHAMLHVMDHMLSLTPWWNLPLQFRLRHAMRKLSALRFEDVHL